MAKKNAVPKLRGKPVPITPAALQSANEYIYSHADDKHLSRMLKNNVGQQLGIPQKAPDASPQQVHKFYKDQRDKFDFVQGLRPQPDPNVPPGILPPPEQYHPLSTKAYDAARLKQTQNKWADKKVGKLLKNLQDNGLSEGDARHALLQQLLQKPGKQDVTRTKGKYDPKHIQFGQSFQNPTEAAFGGAPTIELHHQIKDPFLTMKNAKDKRAAFGNLEAAAFERSPAGQAALRSNDPKIQVGLFKEQYSQQVMDNYTKVAAPDGLADMYDRYLEQKDAAAYMTTSQKKAAGLLNLIDPLTEWGLTGASGRAWLGIPKGVPLNGQSIKAGAIKKLQAERASIATGFPQPGSQLGEVLKALSLSPNGKQLANVFENLAFPQALQSSGVFGLEAGLQAGIRTPATGKKRVTLGRVQGATGKPAATTVAIPPPPKVA